MERLLTFEPHSELPRLNRANTKQRATQTQTAEVISAAGCLNKPSSCSASKYFPHTRDASYSRGRRKERTQPAYSSSRRKED